MKIYITEPLQGGQGVQSTRLWAHVPGGAVIVANFDVSESLRHETKVATARRARAAYNFVAGLSTEQIEEALKKGVTIGTNGLAMIVQGR